MTLLLHVGEYVFVFFWLSEWGGPGVALVEQWWTFLFFFLQNGVVNNASAKFVFWSPPFPLTSHAPWFTKFKMESLKNTTWLSNEKV